jgi:hypothetical protein
MRPEEFKQLLTTRPFAPLRIHMTDGRTFDIRHPDQVLVARSTIDIGVEPDPNGIVDRAEFCSLLHVVRIERLASQASSN